MTDPTPSTTIQDVARHAGVSIATVSRVLNGTAPVIPSTAARVQQAIRELQYVPRTAARVLARRRTDTIGLLLPEISGAFFSPMLRGIEAGVRESGYALLIYATQRAADAPLYRPLGDHNTDGLLVFTDSMDDDDIVRLHRAGFPLVLLHQTPPDGVDIPVVTIENKDGAFKLVEHIIVEHGRRRIGFLRGPERHEDSAWRERGYLEALAAYDIPFDPGLVAYGEFDEQAAAVAINQWLLDGVEFDAVFTGDDDAAMGVLHALRRGGRRVPEDVAVIGFDDVPFAPYVSPPLTTVRAPTEQIGREAVRQLVRVISGEPVVPLTLLPTELVIRNSCGCP
jgi:DNA-binding LacI/PurR family transcriptional regulator